MTIFWTGSLTPLKDPTRSTPRLDKNLPEVSLNTFSQFAKYSPVLAHVGGFFLNNAQVSTISVLSMFIIKSEKITNFLQIKKIKICMHNIKHIED